MMTSHLTSSVSECRGRLSTKPPSAASQSQKAHVTTDVTFSAFDLYTLQQYFASPSDITAQTIEVGQKDDRNYSRCCHAAPIIAFRALFANKTIAVTESVNAMFNVYKSSLIGRQRTYLGRFGLNIKECSSPSLPENFHSDFFCAFLERAVVEKLKTSQREEDKDFFDFQLTHQAAIGGGSIDILANLRFSFPLDTESEFTSPFFFTLTPFFIEVGKPGHFSANSKRPQVSRYACELLSDMPVFQSLRYPFWIPILGISLIGLDNVEVRVFFLSRNKQKSYSVIPEVKIWESSLSETTQLQRLVNLLTEWTLFCQRLVREAETYFSPKTAPSKNECETFCKAMEPQHNQNVFVDKEGFIAGSSRVFKAFDENDSSRSSYFYTCTENSSVHGLKNVQSWKIPGTYRGGEIVSYDYIPFMEDRNAPVTVQQLRDVFVQLMEIHKVQYVHADIRLANIVFSPARDNKPPCGTLIDFDLSQLAGKGKYPQGFCWNVKDGQRDQDAQPNNTLRFFHDIFSLHHVFSLFRPQEESAQLKWGEVLQAMLVLRGKLKSLEDTAHAGQEELEFKTNTCLAERKSVLRLLGEMKDALLYNQSSSNSATQVLEEEENEEDQDTMLHDEEQT